MHRQRWHSLQRTGPAFSHSETVGRVTGEAEHETRAMSLGPQSTRLSHHLHVLSYFDCSKGDTALLLNQIHQPLLIILYTKGNLGIREQMGKRMDTMESKIKVRPNCVLL